MAISKTSIINKALTQVGATPIVNIDDGTNNANVVKRVYELSLYSILSEAKWNFATKRDNISVSTDTLDWYDTGETHIYTKPADMIRVFGCNPPSATWRQEQGYIISDSAELGLRYVYYNDTVTTYPPAFIDAFIDKLCSDIAYTIVNSTTLGDKFKTLYESVSLPKAMASDAQSGIQQVLQDDAWENAKYHNRNFSA